MSLFPDPINYVQETRLYLPGNIRAAAALRRSGSGSPDALVFLSEQLPAIVVVEAAGSPGTGLALAFDKSYAISGLFDGVDNWQFTRLQLLASHPADGDLMLYLTVQMVPPTALSPADTLNRVYLSGDEGRSWYLDENET